MKDNQHNALEAIVSSKEGVSAVWLVPLIALLFGAWLIIKSVSERGVYVTVQFNNASGIVVGKTEVRYKGLPIGVVKGVDVTDDLQSLLVKVEMVSNSKDLLTDNTKFWYVTADVSFQGVSGLDTLLSGSYINVQPNLENKGNPSRFFVALNEEPELDKSTPGLHITLKTDTLGSVSKNSPVSYKQITVGHVSGFQYDQQDNNVNISVFIKPKHAHLVKQNSVFWNASGFEFTGSLASGVKVKTESIGSIISGGIAFDDPKFEQVLPFAKSGQTFKLHPDFQTAEMGHDITLIINWDAGIDRGAIIEYQGLTLGIIDSFSKIDPQTRKITALAKVNPRVVPYLTSESQFFVVAPEFDLGGVTNLHTLLKGPHLSLRPSLKGEAQNQFTVFNQRPAYDYDEPGLHLVIKAKEVDSIKAGTGIFYKKQKVGTVQAVEDKASDTVLIHIHIQKEFAHYITSNTRFWNASGIKVSGNLQGVNVQAHSIQSILAGGIAFDVVENTTNQSVENGDQFVLYPSKVIANQSLPIRLLTQSTDGLKIGTRIVYRGEKIGSIHAIIRKGGTVLIDAGILPEFNFLLKQQSQFWTVRSKFTIAGLKNPDALLNGAYIGVNSGVGESQSEFTLYDYAPAKNTSAQGLQLTLTTNKNNPVNPGSPVTYRGLLVGQIDNIALHESGESIVISLTIDEEYRHLVTNYSRFFNSSGVSISGSLADLTVRTASADSVVRGGVSFINPANSNTKDETVQEGESFALFKNIDHAKLASMAVEIYFNDIAGLKSGLKIKYQEQQIGVVSHIDFQENGFGANAYAYLNNTGKKFAVENTKFWLAKTELGLVGSTNVSSLLEGGFIGVIPGNGKTKHSFIAEDIPPAISQLPYGLNLTLVSNKLGSVRVGNPVLYRQVKVGTVIGVDLGNTADKVNIYVNIANKYAPLVTQQSKFWNTSGFSVKGGIFSGINLESESLETILSGGIAFATPEKNEQTGLAITSQPIQFELYQDAKDEWLDWSPSISIE